MARPKKLQSVANSNNGTTQSESNDLQFDTNVGIEETTKSTAVGNQPKKRTYTRKKDSKQIASVEKDGNNIEEVTHGLDNNMKKDSTRTMEKRTKSDVDHEDICRSNDMPTVCHNKDMEKPGKRSKGKKRSTISVLKQDIDEGSLEIKKRRRNTSMQEPSSIAIAEKESTKESSQNNLKPSEVIIVDKEEENATRIIPINQLQPYDRNWTIKVTILRRGMVEPYSTSKGSGNMWKLILMDEQGTRIQAVLFNDVINLFEQTFLKENSYFISNGLVKPVNTQYANVHKEVEVMLTNNTRVEKAKLEITLNSFQYEFTSFEDLQHAGQNDIVDVLGLVVNVEQLSSMKKAVGVGMRVQRNVTLLNSRSEVVLLTLWGDLAKNEGEELDRISKERPPIAVSRAKVTTNSGLLSLSTLSITTLQIKPASFTQEHMKEWFSFDAKAEDPEEILLQNKIKTAEKVTISDLIERPSNNFQKMYCYFRGTIISIENMEKIWYEACAKCHKKVHVIETKAECHKCHSTNIEISPRYMMKLTVGDGVQQINVTLFDAAKRLVGCTISEFIKVLNEEGENNKFYKHLINCYGECYMFFTRTNMGNDKDRMAAKVIVQDIFKEKQSVDAEIEGIDQMDKDIKIERD